MLQTPNSNVSRINVLCGGGTDPDTIQHTVTWWEHCFYTQQALADRGLLAEEQPGTPGGKSHEARG